MHGYFANRAGGVEYPTLLKIRDALSSILRSAVDAEFLEKDPLDGLKLPKDKRPRRAKPVLTPQQFDDLLELIPEPYATMVCVCLWAGLRASEVIGLRWRDIHPDAIVISERYCRGDWERAENRCFGGADRCRTGTDRTDRTAENLGDFGQGRPRGSEIPGR